MQYNVCSVLSSETSFLMHAVEICLSIENRSLSATGSSSRWNEAGNLSSLASVARRDVYDLLSRKESVWN